MKAERASVHCLLWHLSHSHLTSFATSFPISLYVLASFLSSFHTPLLPFPFLYPLPSLYCLPPFTPLSHSPLPHSSPTLSSFPSLYPSPSLLFQSSTAATVRHSCSSSSVNPSSAQRRCTTCCLYWPPLSHSSGRTS